VKQWEIIADTLKKAGWSLGWVSALIPTGGRSGLQTHHRDDGKRFVVRAEEKLTAFVELGSTIFAGALAQRAASTEFPSQIRRR